MRRLQAIGALVRPTLKLLPWLALAGGGLAGLVLVWLARRDPFAGVGEVVTLLRLSAVPVVMAVVFGLEDPLEDDLAGAGLSVATRRWLRVVLLVLVAAGLWWGLLTFAAATPGLTQSGATALPAGAMTIEAGAMLAIALAATAATPRDAAVPASFAAPVVLAGLLVVAPFLPDRVALVPAVRDADAWRAAHLRWAWLGASALALFALLCRDPGRCTFSRLIHPARPSTAGRSTRPAAGAHAPEVS